MRSRAIVATMSCLLINAACLGNPASPDPIHATHTGHATSQVAHTPGHSSNYDIGSFAVLCGFSHRSQSDPIVFPDQEGLSHFHDFFGATTTHSGTDSSDLAQSPNTCDSSGDRSAYWVPTLFSNDEAVSPMEAAAYYRVPTGVDPSKIVAPPNGLKVLSLRSGWSCSRTAEIDTTARECPKHSLLRLILEFPDCWNGVSLDSPDHRSHVAASIEGRCPATAPVHLPVLVLEVRYPPRDPRFLRLSSGDITDAHGDAFLNWDREVLEREVRTCLVRRGSCDLTWTTVINSPANLQ